MRKKSNKDLYEEQRKYIAIGALYSISGFGTTIPIYDLMPEEENN